MTVLDNMEGCTFWVLLCTIHRQLSDNIFVSCWNEADCAGVAERWDQVQISRSISWVIPDSHIMIYSQVLMTEIISLTLSNP